METLRRRRDVQHQKDTNMELKKLINQPLEDCKIHFVSSAGQGEKVLEIFSDGFFEEDQQYQRRKNFSRPYVISLIGLHGNAFYLFAGVFEVTGVEKNTAEQPFAGDCLWKYKTHEVTGYEKLVGRLLIKSHKSIGRAVYRLADKVIDSLEVFEYLSEPLTTETLLEKNKIRSATRDFYEDVKIAANQSKRAAESERKKFPVKPKTMQVVSTVFQRNPYVVIDVLRRAQGICERCSKKAPFKRKTDGSPYLEVHHKKMLAHGGEDTVSNAIALCPNCHREAHYG